MWVTVTTAVFDSYAALWLSQKSPDELSYDFIKGMIVAFSYIYTVTKLRFYFVLFIITIHINGTNMNLHKKHTLLIAVILVHCLNSAIVYV